MKVHDILSFIENLQKEKKQISCDVGFLKSLSERFAAKDRSADLTHEDVGFLVNLYKLRWSKIYDTAYDYTLDPSNTTQQWVSLAKQVAIAADLSYLKILMYTITNSEDPHDGSKLTETKTLTNFYIAFGGNTLCRKRSFYDHLVKNDLELSTCRTPNEIRLVTLTELSRLRRCKQAKGVFSIADERSETVHQFESFYDFMYKLPLSILGKRGKMPKVLLPFLLELIEFYYSSKSNISISEEECFIEFRKKARDFFKCLYGCELTEVNFLYGQKVLDGGQEYRLLDVLLAIFEAKRFDIDFSIRLLAKFLFQYHPRLRADSAELIPLYMELSAPPEGGIVDRGGQLEAYENCRSLLVSLFVTKFKFNLLSRCFHHTIGVWDVENSIPDELFAIYTILQGLTGAPEVDYAKTYADLLQEQIIPKSHERGLKTWFIRDSSVSTWLQHVKSLSLAEAGGYWFGTMDIASAVSIFQTDREEARKYINVFMDNVINTYVHDKPEFLNQLRVNILFSQLLTNLNREERRNLILLATLSKKDADKKSLVANCALHIARTLVALGYVLAPEPLPQFFIMDRKSENPIELLLHISREVETVPELVDCYSKKLPTQHLGAKIQEAIAGYLFKIKDTKLADVERADALNGIQPVRDPIAAPS